MDPRLLLIMFMLGCVAVMLAIAFSGPSTSKAQARRLASVTGRYAAGSESSAEIRMRKAISARLRKRESNALQSIIPNPQNLTQRLARSGKKWSLNQYFMICGGVFVATFIFGLYKQWSLLSCLFFGTAAGLGLPYMYLGRLINKRTTDFITHFPDALDLMVRGLRSGLPVGETLGVVAREIPGAVGEEFKSVAESIKIGKTMDQALTETSARMGIAEIQFFCITLNIQRETGGNLAETLANLSKVLRQRGQMKLKIRAMSSEAKASAWIIGSLPFIVFALISWINYSYMEPFYTSDPNGLFGLGLMQMVGIGGMCWMGIGVFIMAQMINFEI